MSERPEEPAAAGAGQVRSERGTLQLSRRHAAGPATARGLLFTVLGEFVLPAGGEAWTAAFIDVLGRLGVAEKAARQALMRTAADGWLTAERTGRRTCWRLTSRATELLTDGAARIYGFTASRDQWPGTWLIVLARVPETGRAARHVLRTRMSRAGFGSPAPGVWLSPDAGRVAEATAVLADAGLLADSQVFAGQYAAGGHLTDLVRAAWDLTAIEGRYEDFLAEFASTQAADPLARLTDLVHAWRRFPWIDPVLPAGLLPEGWSGARAAAVFRDRHARWQGAALGQWRQISAG